MDSNQNTELISEMRRKILLQHLTSAAFPWSYEAGNDCLPSIVYHFFVSLELLLVTVKWINRCPYCLKVVVWNEFWGFHPEDGGSMKIRNVGILPQHYTAFQPRRTWLESYMKCFVKGSAFWRLCVLFWRVLEEHLITSNVLEQRSEYLVLYVLYTCTQFSSKASDKSYLNLSGEVTQQVLNR
jgi:hypothetical protein